MKQWESGDELFEASHLTILLTFSVFSVILIAESLLLSWERWPLVIVAGGIVMCWILHIRDSLNPVARIWIYSAMIVFDLFFYGSHKTSTFDLVAVTAVLMILITITGMKHLITFFQIVYYITMGYGLITMYTDGDAFDSLIITRAALHCVVITVIGIITKWIIGKWEAVIRRSDTEIENLTDATERLNDFLANVSHEIRTPINAVIGLTGICIESEQDPVMLDKLSDVQHAGRRVAEQISDILDYSEIDRDKLANNYEDYILSSVLNDLVTELRVYKDPDIELVIDVDPTIPAMMNSDVSKLRKILKHLIMNGLKYTREGGVYVRIAPEEQDYGINLMIEVTDTGIGMTPEEVERITERFYQVDSGRARQGGGLGIGMSIVYGFVSALGGFMMVESEVSKGTTVRVSVPQKVVDPSSCMSVRRHERLCLGAYLHFDKFENPSVREYYNIMVRNIVKGLGVQMHRVDNAKDLKKLMDSTTLTHLFVGEEEYETVADLVEPMAGDMMVVVVADSSFRLPKDSRARIMEKPFYCFPVVTVLNMEKGGPDQVRETMYCDGVRALVVDDEPMNLVVARNIFGRYGMIVTTAASGQESIDLCREREFDIVFMDHMMPGMDGVEAMKHIRGGGSRKRMDIPIVALTANAVSTAKEMFLAEGFDGFVSKPVELVELERVLKRVLPVSKITYGEDRHAVRANLVQGGPSQKEIEQQRQEQAEKITDFERLAALGFNTDIGLKYSAGDAEFYKTLLLQFVDEADEKCKSMLTFCEQGDLDNYRIVVHALKSTSKMIGHMAFSEKAKGLEQAAKDGNKTYIEQNNKSVISECKELAEGISAIYKSSGDSADDDEIMDFMPT